VSDANVELLRRLNALANGGDWDAAIEAFHPDVEWVDLSHAPDTPELVHGRKAIRALWSDWNEVFDEFGVEVYDYVDADPWVICDVRWHGRGRGGDIVVDVRQADAYEVRDGKVIRAVLAYPDKATALEAVRAREG
jgi:ketosteroid isomerase-like protein